MPRSACLPVLLVCRSITCHLLFLSASVLLLLYKPVEYVQYVSELVLLTLLLIVLSALFVLFILDCIVCIIFVSSCILSPVYLLGVPVGYWRGCPVAVKSLHEELAKEHHKRCLFEQEVSVCSRLHHPNIASICGVIQQRDAPFSLIMELLQASLSDVIEAALLSDRYLTLREQTDLSHDCLSGFTYLHDLVGVSFNLLSLPDCVCLSD